MKAALPLVLAINGGFVDTAGFMALQGLFTAHVTGNFVTAAAALVFGTSGVFAKLLATPVFCVVVGVIKILSVTRYAGQKWQLRQMLLIQLALLLTGAILVIQWGPFSKGDGPAALFAGMTLVAAMAVQNAVHRIYLASAPPSTLMTGSTTQLMIDLIDSLRLARGMADREALRTRLARTATTILTFATGCACAALLLAQVGQWCFVVPPLLLLVAVTLANDTAS